MMDEQTCENWANDMKSRLINLVDNRSYVFRDTKRELAEKYLASRKQFAGMSDNDIQALEHKLSIPLPIIFKAYLRVMGRQQGLLFWGSDSDPDDFLEYRVWAEEIFVEQQIPSFLTPNSVIFGFHQGFAFWYFDVISIHRDTPVWKYIQRYDRTMEAKSFKNFIEGRISWLDKLENRHRETGGFYRIITDKGTCREERTEFP